MTIAWKPEAQPDYSADTLLIGDSAAMRHVRDIIRQVAPTMASVLITGPSGSGKELVAKALHFESRRAEQCFIAVNCGAIPSELMESELFGHERGSFTGAISQVRGRFEDADGGTLFLDEIGDMPATMQVKLLRVLEERVITRVGGRATIPIDTRIVSATHRDLDSAINEGRFREDLFYRLSVFPIHLPSLAERREDIPALVAHFIEASAHMQKVHMTDQALDRLIAHRWPGNVRELRNVMERAAILYPGREIGAEEIELLLYRRHSRRKSDQAAMRETEAMQMATQGELALPDTAQLADRPGQIDLKLLVAEFEQRHIIEALQQSRGVVADAARLLSLQRTTLIEKMQKYGVTRIMS